MIVTIEEARPVHVYEILHNLRVHDKAAFERVDDPTEALLDAMAKSSRSYVGLIDGEAACLWGINARTLLLDTVYFWMVTSAVVDQHPFVFVRHSQRMAQSILEEYGTIEGHVFLENRMSAKWLRWLGATFQGSPIEGVLEFKLRRA